MIDLKSPIVSTLLDKGFKLSAHAYVRDDRVQVQCIAINKESGLKFDADSFVGLEDAWSTLAENVRLDRPRF